MKLALVRVLVVISFFGFGISTTATAAQTYVEPKTGMEFVWVPKGTFLQGQCEAEKEMLIQQIGEENYQKLCTDELPQHEESVPGMWIGKYEVTRQQFKKFVENTEYKSDAENQGYSLVWTGQWEKREGIYWDNPDSETSRRVIMKSADSDETAKEPAPVVHVSWNDAKAMAIWLGKVSNGMFRLPTEDEWEFGARAKTKTCRYWGESVKDACAYANLADQAAKRHWPNIRISQCDDGYTDCAPVGSYKPNQYELYDMLGNVMEWCEDPYYEDAYIRHARNNCCCENFGTFGTEVIVYVNGAENVRIHTSCSEPIAPGMKFGDFEMIKGFSRLCGSRCPVGEKPRDDQSQECGPCEGKVSELTLKYQGPTRAAVSIEQAKDGKRVFEQEVGPNGEFSFQGTAEWSNDCYEAYEQLLLAGKTDDAVIGSLRCGATPCDILGETVGLGVSADEILMALVPLMKNPPLAVGNDGPLRVVRGGSWVSPPEDIRSAHRASSLPATANSSLGFRLVWVNPDNVTSCVRSPRVKSISKEKRKIPASPYEPL